MTNLPKAKRGPPKAKRGATPKLRQGSGGRCGKVYQDVTGRKPTRVTNPDTNEGRGIFLRFLAAVFAAAKVDGKPISHVQRLTAGRKARQKIAP